MRDEMWVLERSEQMGEEEDLAEDLAERTGVGWIGITCQPKPDLIGCIFIILIPDNGDKEIWR